MTLPDQLPESTTECPHCGHHLSMYTEEPASADEVRAFKIIDHVASWRFPAALLTVGVCWLAFNLIFQPFEQHPVVMLSILGVTLTTIGALQGPLILLTQIRSAARDRARDRATYLVSANVERDMHDMSGEIRHLRTEVARLTAGPATRTTPADLTDTVD